MIADKVTMLMHVSGDTQEFLAAGIAVSATPVVEGVQRHFLIAPAGIEVPPCRVGPGTVLVRVTDEDLGYLQLVGAVEVQTKQGAVVLRQKE